MREAADAIFEFIRMPDSTGFGNFTESGQEVPAIDGSTESRRAMKLKNINLANKSHNSHLREGSTHRAPDSRIVGNNASSTQCS